jgi:diguanylate cyclase (GGDEF)-like protein/PAS domain S-box-containing protein
MHKELTMPLKKTLDFERQAAIEFAQLGQLISNGQRALLVSAILGVVLAYGEYGRVSSEALFAWVAVLFASITARMLINFRYQQEPVHEYSAVHRRLQTVRIGIFASSLVWGLAVFLFAPSTAASHEMFFAFMIAGMSAGGVMAYSIDIKSAAIYSSVLVLPLATRFLMSDAQYGQAMGIAGYLYLIYVLVTLRNVNKDLLENITLRLDAVEHNKILEASEQRYKSLLNHLPVGVMHYDHDLNITFANPKMTEVLHGTSEIEQHHALKLTDDVAIANVMERALRGQTAHYEGQFNSEFRHEKTWLHLISAPTQNSDGEIAGGIAIMQNITAEKQAQEEIRQLAFYDALTNLPNRRLLLERLQRAVANSARTGKRGAIIYIDLDHFKTLNDTLGHDVGDMLLKQVAERLTQSVRQVDTVARIGGDEYVILLENLSEHRVDAVHEVETVGNKIRDALNHPYYFNQYEYFSTPSMGVAMFDEQQVTSEELLKQADIAMYQAKKAGRNAFRCFNPRMQEMINARMNLEDDLRKALAQKQLQLYYQVQVNQDLVPVGAEALLRWKNPRRGMISPLEFVPVAEETGLILPIGLWVLQSACAQLKKWQQKPETKHLTLSVNVSARQFHQIDFASQVAQAITQHGINPSLLKLELTETMLLDRADSTIATMNAIRELGVGFSLDDFGTGYSSLQYLKELPLEQLKMDQSFVRDIALDGDDKAIACTIIAVAQRLQMEVIAEGVETQEQMQFLLAHGCQRFQGHYFGKPLSVTQFEKTLKRTNRAIAQENAVMRNIMSGVV